MNRPIQKLSQAVKQLAELNNSQPSFLLKRRIGSLRKQVFRLSKKVRDYSANASVKTLLALAAAVLSGTNSDVIAQQFSAPVRNPFGLQIFPNRLDGDILLPSFGDIDGDGDLDMFSVSYDSNALIFQENIGTVSAPDFDTRISNPFGIVMPNDAYYLIPTLADVDNDGDLDLLSRFNSYSYDSLGNSIDNGITLFYNENVGTSSQPAFGDTTRIEIDGLNEYFITTQLVDIDADGDLDIIGSGSYYGEFTFLENTALPGDIPAFADVQLAPFGLSTRQNHYEYIVFGDLDLDGDLDMLSYSYRDSYMDIDSVAFVYRENIGSVNSALYGTPKNNPFGLAPFSDSYIGIPSLADIDSDGDLDLFLLTYDETFERYELLYYENTGTVSVNEIEITEVEIFPNPASSRLSIKSSEIITQIKAIDMLGATHSLAILGNNQVNINHLPKGTYTILATQIDGTRLHARLIKQ